MDDPDRGQRVKGMVRRGSGLQGEAGIVRSRRMGRSAVMEEMSA